MGGFMTPYANSIGSSIIEQISCLSFVSKSFSGKILSYIFGGCMLGLMSAELVIESRISFSRVVCNQMTMGISMLRVDVGRKQRTPSTSVSTCSEG